MSDASAMGDCEECSVEIAVGDMLYCGGCYGAAEERAESAETEREAAIEDALAEAEADALDERRRTPDALDRVRDELRDLAYIFRDDPHTIAILNRIERAATGLPHTLRMPLRRSREAA